MLKCLIVLIGFSQHAFGNPVVEAGAQVKGAKDSIITDMLPDLSWLHSPTLHLATSGEQANDKPKSLDDVNLVMAASMMPGRRRLDDSQGVPTEDLDTKFTGNNGKESGDDFFEDDRVSDSNKNRRSSMGGKGGKSKKSGRKINRQQSLDKNGDDFSQESRKRGMKPVVGNRNIARSSSETIEDLLGNNDDREEAEDDESERRSDSVDYNDSNEDDDENEQQSAEQSRPRPNRKSRPFQEQRANRRSDDGESDEASEEDEDSDSSNDVRRSAKPPVPEEEEKKNKGNKSKGKKEKNVRKTKASKRKTQKRSSEDEKSVESKEPSPRAEKVEEDESTAAAASNQLKHSSAELQPAAGHHHGHSHHGHYYQYAEVPKKKAWKFGYKRGNKKHTSKLPLISLDQIVQDCKVHDRITV